MSFTVGEEGKSSSGFLPFFSTASGLRVLHSIYSGIQIMLMQQPTYEDVLGFIVNHCVINKGEGSGTARLSLFTGTPDDCVALAPVPAVCSNVMFKVVSSVHEIRRQYTHQQDYAFKQL